MTGNVSYENLSDSLKQKIEESNVEIVNDLTTGGADKALSAEQGKIIKTELDKRVVINKFHPSRTMTNLAQQKFTKVFYASFSNSTTSEVAEIVIPPSVAFSGSIELNLTSAFYNSDATGTAKIMIHITMSEDGVISTQEVNILTMTPQFARNFYVGNITWVAASKVYVLNIYKRQYSNPLQVEMTLRCSGRNFAQADVDALKMSIWNAGSIISPTEFPIQQSIFTHVGNSKQDLATAITGKGVPTTADNTFAQMVANINAIQSGNVTLDIVTATANSNAEAFYRASGGGTFHSVFVDVPVEDNSKVITMYGYGYYATNLSGNFVYDANSEGAGIEMNTAKSFITNSAVDLGGQSTRHAKCVLFNSKKIIRVPVMAATTYTVFVVSRNN